MLSRINRTLDRIFPEWLKSVRKEINELNNDQILGSDSIVTRRIFSSDPYDLQITSIGFNNRRFILRFTPDNPDIKTTGLVNRMEYLTTYDTSAQSIGVYCERQKVINGNIQEWIFDMSASDTYVAPYIRFKFYFWASGGGTFTTQII